MKKTKLLLIVLICFPFYLISQSISPERVSKIKVSTVKIIIGNGKSVGTGFFVDNSGTIATCFHVVEPGIRSDGTMDSIRAQTSSGEIIQLRVPNFLNRFDSQYAKFDFFLLVPEKKTSIGRAFLKLGNFGNLQEGDDIYTCGFPFGENFSFLSKGLVSTKTVTNMLYNGSSFSRNIAYLDLTMNRGNSGGAIIKMGKTPELDEVIAMADFIVSPGAHEANDILKSLVETAPILQVGGQDFGADNKNFAYALSNNSNGIGGCISIEYLKNVLSEINSIKVR
jgi:serine protease Do